MGYYDSPYDELYAHRRYDDEAIVEKENQDYFDYLDFCHQVNAEQSLLDKEHQHGWVY